MEFTNKLKDAIFQTFKKSQKYLRQYKHVRPTIYVAYDHEGNYHVGWQMLPLNCTLNQKIEPKLGEAFYPQYNEVYYVMQYENENNKSKALQCEFWQWDSI